jgi:hypothetical protein
VTGEQVLRKKGREKEKFLRPRVTTSFTLAIALPQYAKMLAVQCDIARTGNTLEQTVLQGKLGLSC